MGTTADTAARAPLPALLALWAAVLCAAPAGAVTPPPFGWVPRDALTLGPSLAALRAPALGWAATPGLEVGWTHRLRNPLHLWLALGVRMPADRAGRAFVPYAEAGVALLFLDLGVGYGRAFGDRRAPRDSLNGFVGLSIPLFTPRAGHLLYLLPYYRPGGDLAGGGAFHEVGAMLKWLWMLRPAHSSDEAAIRSSP